MSRTQWITYIKEGEEWVEDSYIYAPNESLSSPILSTQTKIQLQDGDNAFMTPSIKSNKEPLEFIWLRVDDTYRTKIENYVINQTDLKIIDSKSREYIGRFISVEPIWLVSIDENENDLRAVFEIMPNL